MNLPTANKRFAHCPECGMPMSATALLCRDCYKRGGATGAPIYRAAAARGEASPRSRKYYHAKGDK